MPDKPVSIRQKMPGIADLQSCAAILDMDNLRSREEAGNADAQRNDETNHNHGGQGGKDDFFQAEIHKNRFHQVMGGKPECKTHHS